MGKIVNQAELAEILGKSDVTIWEWQKDGLPIAKQGARGSENQYDTEAVIGWIEQRAALRAGKGESQRDREARLRGDMLEIELAEKQKVMVPFTDIAPAWEGRVLAAAAYMRSRASQLAGQLEATQGIEAKRALLRESDAGFLNHLGVEGERMQTELDALLEKLAAGEAEAFLRRIAGNDTSSDHPGGAQTDLG